jgi:hypothetical protein
VRCNHAAIDDVGNGVEVLDEVAMK